MISFHRQYFTSHPSRCPLFRTTCQEMPAETIPVSLNPHHLRHLGEIGCVWARWCDSAGIELAVADKSFGKWLIIR